MWCVTGQRLAVLLACLWTFLVAAPGAAADPKPAVTDSQALERYVHATLRYVINHGVDLFNKGDVEGCYQHFRRSLDLLAPVLAHRPELQEAIRTALEEVEKNPDWRVKTAGRVTSGGQPVLKSPASAPEDRQKAFALRAVLDEVRAELEPKKADDKKPAATGKIQGNVTYKGQPLPGGRITFVPSGGAAARAADIGKDGAFTVTAIAPGKYRIAIEEPKPGGAVKIPQKYADAKTSGLEYEAAAGNQRFDINLP